MSNWSFGTSSSPWYPSISSESPDEFDIFRCNLRSLSFRWSQLSTLTMKPVSGRKSPVLYLLGILTVLLCPDSLQAVCQKPEISNGKLSVEKDQYVTPENVTITCDPGYRMVGSQNIFCSENKSWSPDVPKCEKVPAELCEAVLKGQKLLKCLPNALEEKVALELYKLSLEIEKLEQEKRKEEIA
ncbi:hypothetical protein MJG53_010930 [Ovis ammon polii x Ovis aries]|uniref:Uncharacterized protein n=1 Tax=Ovis ammon polii x Ovis aries TaxID=2918886 RepID=A0ACB9UQQ8_9CETA|nr:hypothetical protein MJG53_010930 [Ovis ammon polii x Ovis aries]